MKRTCKQCGKEFFISQSEINFYKSKNLSIPKRCKECRESNKQKKNTDAAAEYVKNSNDSDSSTQSVSKKENNTGTGKKILYSAAAVLVIAASAVFGGNKLSNTDNPGDNTQYSIEKEYTFANSEKLNEHFEKHGREMGFDSASAYEKAASKVVTNPDALFKTESEDGDEVYYVEATNEFVIVDKTTGYIKTYYYPSGGKDYFDRQ